VSSVDDTQSFRDPRYSYITLRREARSMQGPYRVGITLCLFDLKKEIKLTFRVVVSFA